MSGFLIAEFTCISFVCFINWPVLDTLPFGCLACLGISPNITWRRGYFPTGRAASATRARGLYLGEWATVADAEEVGVLLAWEDCGRVVLDSQGVIQKIWSLQYVQPRSWIEEALVGQMRRRPRTLMWVKGHQGKKATRKQIGGAKREVGIGRRLQKTVISCVHGCPFRRPFTRPFKCSWPKDRQKDG